jgi:hypothetical protein
MKPSVSFVALDSLRSPRGLRSVHCMNLDPSVGRAVAA